ncbi:MAG: hypothetical protein ABL916_17850 [Burkholderiaceae bacterium]
MSLLKDLMPFNKLALRVLAPSMFAIHTAFCFAGEDRSLEPERLSMASKLVDASVSMHICENQGDCNRRQVIFVSPANNGLSVSVYGVTNYSSIATLVSVVIREAESLPTTSEVEVAFMAISKEESVGRFFWVPEKKLLRMTIKGGSHAKR